MLEELEIGAHHQAQPFRRPSSYLARFTQRIEDVLVPLIKMAAYYLQGSKSSRHSLSLLWIDIPVDG